MEQMNLIISTVLIILGTFNIATLASPMKHDHPEFNSERKVRIYYDAHDANIFGSKHINAILFLKNKKECKLKPRQRSLVVSDALDQIRKRILCNTLFV